MPAPARDYISPLRYPGGKSGLLNYIRALIHLNGLEGGHYVEVYAGGAGVAIGLLLTETVRRVHINDIDISVWAFWDSVLNHPEELVRQIRDTLVTVDEWDRQRKVQVRPTEVTPLQLGFSTFFLNRVNRSGILTGGLIGGKNQTGTYKIDARYNKDALIRRIERIARLADRISLYRTDAAEFLQKRLHKLPKNTLVYLDPPYYAKGQELYQNHYRPEDHEKISDLVQNISQPWLISYDRCIETMKLYTGISLLEYGIKYSAQTKYEGAEVLFFAPQLQIPDIRNPLKAPKILQSQLL